MKSKKPIKSSVRRPPVPHTRNHGDKKKYDRKAIKSFDFANAKVGPVVPKGTAEAMRLKDVEAKVKKLAREGKVEFAEGGRVEAYPKIRDEFLEHVLGHPEAFISDRSYVSDFFSFGKDRDEESEYASVQWKTAKQFNVDIATKLKRPLCEIFEFIHEELNRKDQ